MIDLDYFHAYNEHYGHPGGDACLRQVADAMVRCLRRPSDFLGRYGGEEFMAVLPNTDAVGAKIVAERLRAAVEALALPHAGSQCSSHVTITVGFAAAHILPTDSTELLVTAADAFLLKAKSDGRNRVGGHAPLVRPSRVSAQRWDQYALVYVDPWFADRIPSFLEAVQREARAQVEMLGTSGRGSAIALRRLDDEAQRFGLVAISSQLRDLATAVREADVTSLRAASDALIQYAMHVQVVYRRTADSDAMQSIARTG
jgi:diguanylate cyclase (GGDEF)-like protein